MYTKAVRWVWLGFTLTRSFMIFLLGVVVGGRAGDEPCENFDRESLGFVLEGFPVVDFLEHKVEERQISLQGRPPLLRWDSLLPFPAERSDRGEHLRRRVRETSLPESRVLRPDSK